MRENDLEIAKKLKEKLLEVVELVDIKVFGSRVKEEFDQYADLDVFIEVKKLDAQLERKMRDIIWEVGFENSRYISPLIFTQEEIENSPLRVSPIVININREGVRV